ncbi:MAG TPA: aminopeptidase N [Streptosporangiaceae bacterium]|nr:aminopeptidase N [Streptosporangiaceae bacterium]
MATALTQAAAARRAALLQVESYQIFLDLTTGVDTARSRTEIRFSCREPGATTFADIHSVAVHEVVLNGVPVHPNSVTDGRLPLPGLAASNTLTVDATVALNRSGSGLTQYTDPVDGSRYVLANCYPTAAPRVFCCFDQPDLRAAVTLIVTLPANWTCVANGDVLHRPADGTAGVWRFSTVLAMKPYEFTLCAGPYVTVPAVTTQDASSSTGELAAASPTRLTVRCRPALASSPGLARVSAVVGATLHYYEQLLGMRCPYDKLEIVFAPQLGPPAMELPAVMYVSETLLQRAADPGDDHVAVVLAHEAAHLWFGCLVEGGWWDDLWLAEAMASYLSYAAATAVLGQPDAWAEFGMLGRASAYQADNLPSTQPISSPVNSAAHALTRPTAITYSKGTAAIRQLAVLIGDESMRAGLHDYLSRHAWSTASLADMIDCLSRASSCDLTQWTVQWLTQPGVNALRPEIIAGPDGVLTSLAIAQDPPETNPAGPLRTHRLTVGIYQRTGSGLRCDRRVDVTVSGSWTHVPELTGMGTPAAIILNDADLTFATIGIDAESWQALVASTMDLGDPLAESVCWTAAWQKVQRAELDAAEFAAIVARRMIIGQPIVGFEQLLARAITGTDFYAGPADRAAGRRQLAAAALSAAERAEPASRHQRVLAGAYASCADSDAQLDLLRFWVAGRSLPAGLVPDLELRGRILATLSARGAVAEDELTAYAADDPVAGDVREATWRAMRPDRQAKQTAWTAALAVGQSPRLARANAEGIWVAGQEHLMGEFRERYFAEALPAIRQYDARTVQRLARALYPVTLADADTLAATRIELASTEPTDPIRAILLEQHTILQRMITARAAARALAPS